MTTTTIPTAESLMEGIGEVARPSKSGYARLRVGNRTLAYCTPRKDGVLLDFYTFETKGAPARLRKSLEDKGGHSRLRVTSKNERSAVALLEWLASHA